MVIGILLAFEAGADVKISNLDACIEISGYLPAEVHIYDCVMVDCRIGEITSLDGFFEAGFDVWE